jgi:hypothetical protein
MDLARFHYAINEIFKDFETIAVDTTFQNLIQQLNNAAGNPGQVSHIDAFRAQLESLRKELERSSLNNPDYETSEALEMLGLREFVGNELYKSLRKLLDENQLSPQSASTALSKFHKDMVEKIKRIQAVNDSFAELKVPYEGTLNGDAEIELRLPAHQGANSLDDLGRESRDWHKDIAFISEVFDPDRGNTTVRTLASGSWVIYLASTPFVLQGVAKCLHEINKIINELIVAKKLIQEFRNNGTPEQLVDPIENHTQQKVKIDLERIADQLVDEFYKSDVAGRRQELKIGLRQTLKRMSKKISEGAKVSLRITPPKKPKLDDDAEPTAEQQAQIDEADRIQKIADNVRQEMSSIKSIETDASVLQLLPAPDSEEAHAQE